jgi:hypothetical protein
MATKPDFDRGWTEPESFASVENPPKYPYNNITQTESGHFFEMDDTPDRERVRLQHRSGTFTETHPDGTQVTKIVGEGYEIVAKDKNVIIRGHCNITIEGDATMHVKGNKYERIDGDVEQEIRGDFTQVVKGKTKILSDDDMTIGANPGFAGSITISTGDHVYLNSDLAIAGELTADKITSLTRVDAGTGVSAGPLGFVSVLGGLSVGSPIALPGNVIAIQSVYAAMTVNAGLSVNSPLGNFGIMNAILMTDVINTTFYNTHIHKAPRGWTSPPILKMI